MSNYIKFIETNKISLVVLLINCVLITGLLAFQRSSTTKVGMVNITGMVNSFIKETAQQSLSVDEKQKKISQFSDALQKVMTTEASEKSMVLVPSEAVIAGATDMTQEVMIAIKKELKS